MHEKQILLFVILVISSKVVVSLTGLELIDSVRDSVLIGFAGPGLAGPVPADSDATTPATPTPAADGTPLVTGTGSNFDFFQLGPRGPATERNDVLGQLARNLIPGDTDPETEQTTTTDCSAIQFCTACAPDTSLSAGIRCNSCGNGRILSASGDFCAEPVGDTSGTEQSEATSNCPDVQFCATCVPDSSRSSGRRCTSCSGGRALSGDANTCNLLSTTGQSSGTSGGGRGSSTPEPRPKGKKGKGKKGRKGPGHGCPQGRGPGSRCPGRGRPGRGGPGRGGPGRGGPGRGGPGRGGPGRGGPGKGGPKG